MDEKQHAPPVPPDKLTARWNDEYKRLPYSARFPSGTFSKYVAHQAAAWGWEQAIPEREELAGLLMELSDEAKADGLHALSARTRAAAERLRGGGSDG